MRQAVAVRWVHAVEFEAVVATLRALRDGRMQRHDVIRVGAATRAGPRAKLVAHVAAQLLVALVAWNLRDQDQRVLAWRLAAWGTTIDAHLAPRMVMGALSLLAASRAVKVVRVQRRSSLRAGAHHSELSAEVLVRCHLVRQLQHHRLGAHVAILLGQEGSCRQ